MRASIRYREFVVAACLGALTPGADATWSIILVNTRTGEIGAACATCIADEDERDWTVAMVPGYGAANVQAAWSNLQSPLNRVQIRDRMILATDPAQILTHLASIDPAHQSRQYGIVDVLGRSASFTGASTMAWTGGQTGTINTPDGPVRYAIQGNVLTGPCVVDGIVAAVGTTPGDLPARLMAAMEAAHAAGGDGRCSCGPTTPTACGCPPATVVKSAHNAFIMASRAGDRGTGPGLYRVGIAPFDVVVRDFNADGRPDVASSNGSSATVSVILNTTPAGSPVPMFGPPTHHAVAAAPRGLVSADITGDGLPDLVAASFSGVGPVCVLPALPSGGFGPRVEYPVGAGINDVVTGDFDGQNGVDVACPVFALNTVRVLLNNGAGVLVPQTPVAIGAGTGPYAITAADMDGDADLDLAVVERSVARVGILTNAGDGTFSLSAEVSVGATPSAIVGADLDADQDIDLAVANTTSNSVSVLRNSGGVLARTDYPIGFGPLGLDAADVDNDGNTDLVAACGATSTFFGHFVVLRGAGSAAFVPGQSGTAYGPLNAVALADLDADGDRDAVMAAFTSGQGGTVAIAGNLGEGRFDSGIGSAGGDYFMSLAAPDTTAGAPDPVTQLQAVFDQWRQTLLGRPDAVRSFAEFTPLSIPASLGGTGQTTMTIRLRDWQDQPVTAALASLQVEVLPGSPAVSVGTPVAQGGGVYTLAIAGGASPGTVRLRVRADDGLRPVVLMPDPEVQVESCYPDCNADGALTVADFGCFQTKFVVGDPYADCNADGQRTVADFGCFQTRFVVGCP